MGVKIRRDRTFDYQGRTYRIMKGSDTPSRDGSYFIAEMHADGDWTLAAEGFGRIDEIRAYIEEAEAKGWELKENLSPGPDASTPVDAQPEALLWDVAVALYAHDEGIDEATADDLLSLKHNGDDELDGAFGAARAVLPIVEREVAAALALWHEECDKVGVPHSAAGLVRHHRHGAEALAQGWQLAGEGWEKRALAAEEALRQTRIGGRVDDDWAERVANIWRDSPKTRAALTERYSGLAWALDHLAYPETDDGADASGNGPRQPAVEDPTSAPSSPDSVPPPRRPLDDPQTFGDGLSLPRLPARWRRNG